MFDNKIKPKDREFINKFLFIDAQYFLTRNYALLKSKEELNVKNLLELTLRSIKKIQNSVLADNIILLWDTYPYKKTQELIAAGVDYKGDREFALDRIKEIEELLKTETDFFKIMTLDEELKQKKKDHEAFLIRSETKRILKKWMPEIGIGSLAIPTMEADDLACFAAVWTDKENIVDVEKREKAVLCSADSDWVSFLSPRSDLYRTVKDAEYLNYSDAPSKIPKKYQGLVNLYEYNLLHDAYYGNHNNVKADTETKEMYTFSQVVKKYKNGELENIPYVNKVFNALNVIKYYNDEIRDEFNKVCLGLKSPSFGAWIDFVSEYELDFYPDFFDELFYYQLEARKK